MRLVSSPSGNSNTQPTPIQQAAQSILSGATGSSLDVNTLVQALVTDKTAGRAAAIARQQQSSTAILSALGAIKSALSTLKTSLTGLADGSLFSRFAATASGKGITATVSAGAAAGSYSVNVEQLATANQVSSKAYAHAAAVGTGTLTIGVGDASMSIELDSKHDGTLDFSASKLQSTLSADPTMAASVFNATNGIGQQLDKLLNEYTLASVGQMDKRTASVNAALTSLAKQQSDLATYQQTLTSQYNAEFTALNRLLTSISNSKTYLNHLFGGDGSPGALNKR